MGIFIRITKVMRWQQRAELNEKDTLNKKKNGLFLCFKAL